METLYRLSYWGERGRHYTVRAIREIRIRQRHIRSAGGHLPDAPPTSRRSPEPSGARAVDRPPLGRPPSDSRAAPARASARVPPHPPPRAAYRARPRDRTPGPNRYDYCAPPRPGRRRPRLDSRVIRRPCPPPPAHRARQPPMTPDAHRPPARTGGPDRQPRGTAAAGPLLLYGRPAHRRPGRGRTARAAPRIEAVGTAGSLAGPAGRAGAAPGSTCAATCCCPPPPSRTPTSTPRSPRGGPPSRRHRGRPAPRHRGRAAPTRPRRHRGAHPRPDRRRPGAARAGGGAPGPAAAARAGRPDRPSPYPGC